MTRATPMPTLSIAARTALATFADHHEKSVTAQDGFAKAVAAERLRQAKAALGEAQRAILELWAIRRRSIAHIAEISGKTTADVGAILTGAADALARHYEAVAE